MRQLIAALILGLWVAVGCAAPVEAPARADIESLLRTQAAAWTRGDLEAFCAVYTDDATFVSPSGLTQGRQAVLDRYRAKYKDKAGMGELTLSVIETRALASTDAVSAIARWTLAWPDKPKAEGLTLLVFIRTKDGWRILQDASM